jgi:DNA-binding NarL/FixJ family response regulator
MSRVSLLLVGAQHNPGAAAALRAAFTDVLVLEMDDAADLGLLVGDFDVAVIRSETNAGFARVRRLRKARRDLPIIVLAERDRSAAAYVAGANEFVSWLDQDGLLRVVRQALESREPVPEPATVLPS